MGMFDLYKSKVVYSKTDKELNSCNVSQGIIKDFFIHPSYEQVYKNFIPDVKYDTIIQRGSAKKKTVPYKELLSYPYSTPQFFIGDYIHWEYGGNNTTWLLLSCDYQYNFSVGGYMYQCKDTLRWIDKNGELQEYPCYTEDTLNETQPDYNKIIHLPEGTVFLYVRYDDNTVEISDNKRFLIGSRLEFSAYKVNGVKNFIDENLVRFTLYRDQVDEVRDDIINGIANAYSVNYTLQIDSDNFEEEVGYTTQLESIVKLNGEIVSKDVTWSTSDELIGTIDSVGNIELLDLGTVVFTCAMTDNPDVKDTVTIDVVAVPSLIMDVRFEPNKTTILYGDAPTEYIVTKYLNNVAQVDGFSFVLSGASTSNYKYIGIDDNTFTIESLGFDYTALKVIATSLVDSSVGEIDIQLKNLF